MAEEETLGKWIEGAQKTKGGVMGKVSLVLVVALITVAGICAKLRLKKKRLEALHRA
jgi:hypothetical protein